MGYYRNRQVVPFVNMALLTSGNSRKVNPQSLTQLRPRSHPRHPVGKRTAQKDVIKDIISDSQVYSYFPYRWSPASLTIKIYFYLFLYLYITRITISNGTPHLKSLKSQNRRAALGRPAIKLVRGGGGAFTSLRSINPLFVCFDVNVISCVSTCFWCI